MKRCTLVALLILQLLPAFGQDEPAPLNVYYGEIPEGERLLFVAPGGDDANAGTEAEPWATLDFAVTQVQRGDVIVMRGGVYEHDETIRIRRSVGSVENRTVVTAYPGEVPILDFSAQPKVRDQHGVLITAFWWHLIGITVRGASHNGIRMDGWYNILEQVTAYGNHDTGIHMAGGAAYNLIKNCDSFRNFNWDPNRTPGNVGENADGFGAKFDIGPGNRYEGVRAWENSDDGFDFWEAANPIVAEDSWAFGNGDASVFGDPEGFAGNGNGFKLGGNGVAADHVVVRSMAFDNFGVSGSAKGFDFNNNPGAMTLVHNTAYNNGRNFYFPVPPRSGQAVFVNNLSVASRVLAVTSPGAVAAGNSWQLGTEVTEDVFLGVDTDLAKRPRERDGSLPGVDLLKPAPESILVDGGVVIGEPFHGAAPDVGAYELEVGEPVEPGVARGSGSLVTGLTVYDYDNAGSWAVRTGIDVGTRPYGDSDAVIAFMGSGVMPGEWIRTAAATRTKNYLFTTATFTLSERRVVFVAHSDDVTEKPEWLSAFSEMDETLTIVEPGGAERRMTVYQRDVEAGEVVTLGRNSTDGTPDAPMYVVIVGFPFPVSVEDARGPAAATALNGVYPNPAGASATVTFDLARGGDVAIGIYDLLGREVAEVARGYYGAGPHAVSWSTAGLPSGVYYCRMAADGYSAVTKLVRLGP